MKNVLLIWALISAGDLLASHDEAKPWNVTILSQEITLDNSYSIDVSYKLKFMDTTFFDNTIGLAKAVYYYEVSAQNSGGSSSWWESSTTNKPDTGFYLPTDSIEGNVQFTYDPDLLPYSFRNIYLQIRDSAGDVITQTMIYIYFTAYGTVEVWNEYDFELLKRSWDSPEQGLLTNSRVFIDRDSIPQSNVSDGDFNNDTVLKHYISLEGLPYRIPMMNITDMDSSESIGNSQLHKRDGCGVNKQKWVGTISGNVVAFLRRDNGTFGDINISGIRVEIWDQDWGWNRDDFLNAGYTDNQGNFSIDVNTCQNFQGINQPESGELELYVVIQSVTQDETIKVRNRLGKTFESVIGRGGNWMWQYNNGAVSNLNMGTLRPDKTDCKPHLLHYANQCRQFVHNSGVGQIFNTHPLHIMRIPMGYNLMGGGNFMLPGAVSNGLMGGSIVISGLSAAYCIANFSRKDGIYRNFSNDDLEGTAYHEFGHYLMWHLQDKSFNMQLPFKDHGLDYNSRNVKLAWSEGWAEGFAQIMDIATRGFDGEAGFDGGIDYENRLFGAFLPENINNLLVKRNRNNPAQTENTVTTGMASEMNIACILVDLYDGASSPNTTTPAWNDANVWDAGQTDNVSLTFAQICQPLLNHQGNFWISNAVLQDIEEYAVELLEISECAQRSAIRNVFTQNRIPSLATPANQLINSDLIWRETEISFPTYKPTNRFQDFANLLFEGDEEITKNLDIFEITANDGFYNLGGFTNPDPITNLDINDNLDVRGGTLFLNNSGIAGGLSGFPIPDPEFITYTANVCAETINVRNAGVLEIGDDGGSDRATMIVKSHSTLTLNNNTVTSQPSIIRVNNNSKLVIEGTLDIFPGSRIILNGDNAILEIKGNLNVRNNATFTFEGGAAGSGHVVFNIPQNDNPKDHIILGNDSRIRFVGTGSSDRVMEVMADMEFWPDNVQNGGNVNSSFEVQDGLIELGHNAILNIGTAINLSHARLYAEPCCPAKGLVLWGQKNSFSFVTMENVTGGIESHNTVGGHPLLMSVVKVSGADRALLSEGKGSIIGAFESDDNPLGIQISGSDWPNTFTIPNIHGATSFGTLYTGSPASNLWIKRANYTDNLAGIDFTGKGNLILSCGKFWNVSGTPTPNNGITQRGGGNLVAADALGYGAGRLSFKDNKNSIVLTKTQPYINDGYNDFRYVITGTNLALSGSINKKPKPSIGYTLNAANNLWDGTQNPVSFCAGGAGTPNYNLTYKRTPFSSPACVTIPNLAITLSQINTAQSARCASTGGAGTAGTGSDKGTLGTAMVINTTHFTNTNLQDAVGTVLDAMYDTTSQNFEEIINLWAELLTEPTYLSPYNEEDYFYIDLAENKMMEALGMLLIKDTTLELSQGGGQSHFETVMDAQDAWITTLENDTAAFSVSLKNIFNFDKGAVYHLSGDNPSAATIWGDMQSWASDDYMDHTDYWLCQIVREEALKNCGNNPDSLANIQECQYSEGENAFRLSDTYGNSKENLPQIQQLKKENKISKHLNLYPNPASTTVTAELETSQKGEASINIYSADGKHIKTLPSIRLNLGINKLIIPVSDLTTGIYTIAIETRNIKWNEKVIID